MNDLVKGLFLGLVLGFGAAYFTSGGSNANAETTGCNKLIAATPLAGAVRCELVKGKLALTLVETGETVRALE